MAPSGRVVVQVDLVRLRDDFAVSVVTARRADVVRALQFAAIGAFVRIASDQRIVRAAHVTAGPGHAILGDGHVSTSGYWGSQLAPMLEEFTNEPRQYANDDVPASPCLPHAVPAVATGPNEWPNIGGFSLAASWFCPSRE